MIAFANGRAQLLFGYAADELLGANAELLVPERFHGAYRDLRGEYFLRPTSQPMGAGKKLFGLRKDGREVPVEIGLNPVETRQGTYTLAVIVDITERIQAEKRRHGAEQMSLAIDGAADAMIVTDRSGRITLVNSQVERMFGYLRQDLLDRSVDMLLPERLREAHSQLRNSHAAQPPQAVGGDDFFGLHKDGREVPIEIGLSQFNTSRGDFVLTSIVDTTERKYADDLRLAHALHAAELNALSSEMRSVEVSLESSELRARRQAERLEALWRVTNNPTLHGQELVLAMLRQATVAIRLTQRFRGVLGRVEDEDVVVVGVGISPDDDDPRAALLKAGSRTPLADTIIPRVSRTQGWDDLATLSVVPNAAAWLGWRAAISTQFNTGGQRYSLTFASPEPMIAPFGPEDFVYVELLAAAFANQLQLNELADSLRAQEMSARQHAERLEALWKIVNDPNLHDEEVWTAMLSQAAAAIQPGQVYQGNLWRIEGTDLVLEAVTDPPHHLRGNFQATAGSRIPLDTTVVGKLFAEGTGTRSWDDIQAGSYSSALVRATGTHSFVISTFKAGGSTWGLSFASTETASKTLGPQAHAYIEVLASFFANHVQQRWQFERIQYQQSHDVLTGLLNRSQFRSQARVASNACGRYGIILVDVDAFSEINESYGHMIGDAMLVEVGSALRARAAVDEIVGRITSDVFGIYVPNPISREFLRRRALDFAETFACGFATGDREGRDFVALTASLGIAVAPDDGPKVDVVLSHADAALVTAKDRGHGSMVFYESGMEG